MAYLTTYTGIKAVLKAKLTALQGADDTALFAGVYDVNETQPDGSPICFVIEDAGSASIADTQRNQREWQFMVTIQQVINDSIPPETAQIALLDAVDRVIVLFDQDWSLKDAQNDAQALFVRVVPVDFSFGTKETGVHQALLRVAVVNFVNNYA